MTPAIDYDALAGKPGPAARLLRCLHERAAGRAVAKDGRAWCPLPRSAVLRDTRLSVDQYHRALRQLRALRLVEDRMAYFKAVRMPHFALARPLDPPVGQAPGHELSVQETAIQGGDTATLEGQVLQSTAFQGGDTPTISRGRMPAGARPGLVSKKEKKVRKKVSKTSVHSHATVEASEFEQGSGKGKAQISMVKKSGKTVAEVLAETKQPPSPPKGDSLVQTWQQGYAQAFACFVPSLTLKERAQLRYFAKGCPVDAPAAAVLAFALANWPLVVTTAQADAGAYSLPGKPNVGFLAKHLGVAVNLWLDAEASKAVIAKNAAQHAAKLVQSTANAKPPPKPAPKPTGEGKATLAEVLAILGQ